MTESIPLTPERLEELLTTIEFQFSSSVGRHYLHTGEHRSDHDVHAAKLEIVSTIIRLREALSHEQMLHAASRAELSTLKTQLRELDQEHAHEFDERTKLIRRNRELEAGLRVYADPKRWSCPQCRGWLGVPSATHEHSYCINHIGPSLAQSLLPSDTEKKS